METPHLLLMSSLAINAGLAAVLIVRTRDESMGTVENAEVRQANSDEANHAQDSNEATSERTQP